MKLLPILLALACTGAALAEDMQRLLTEAQVAYQKGDMVAAKRNFELVNRMDPRNPTAIGYLKMIATQTKTDSAGAAVEKSLTALIVPQVQFKEATFGSALDFMKKKCTEVSGGKQTVNFVVQPGIDQEATRVTLSLSNIPFTEALRYMGELASVKFEYQKYAIMVRPTGAVAKSPEPAPGQ